MKSILIRLLSGRKPIGQAIKYVSVAAATALVDVIDKAPDRLNEILLKISDNTGIELTSTALAGVIALAIAELAQWYVDKQNGKGARRIQEALQKVESDIRTDEWMGDKTIDAVDNLVKRFDGAMKEIEHLRETITTDKKE